jgi:hypothetical protein
MTIYSQHPNRGKVQILATYRGPAGAVSSTITSVEDAALAAPIVDALNRISACATVPVSVWDRRDDRFASYPTAHLAALIDLDARADLLNGAHSLWYEQVKVLLYQALTDLDDATAALPPPVRTAVTAELEAEARGLREALTEYSEGVDLPEDDNRRYWERDAPFVAFNGGLEGLGAEDRARLDRVERGIGGDELGTAAADLRLLLDVHERCANHQSRLLVDDFAITDDPFEDDCDRYFLNVEAPMPNGQYGRDGWSVDICLWVPDPDDDSRASGEPVLVCARSAPPAADEIIELLNRSGGRQEQLAAWAKTAVGEALEGTSFVVTRRFDD